MLIKKYKNLYWVLVFLTVFTTLNAADYYVCDCIGVSDVDCTLGQDILMPVILGLFRLAITKVP